MMNQSPDATQPAAALPWQLYGVREILRDRRLPRWIGIALLCAAAAALVFPAAAVPLAGIGLAVLATVAAAVGVQAVTNAQQQPGSRPVNGIWHIGKAALSGAEVWLTADECRAGMIVAGAADVRGQALLGLSENVFDLGSGMVFVSGQGDVALFAKIYALAKKFGREDDVYLVNLMTSNSEPGSGRILSNTLNPFTSGSSDSLTQMVVSLMDDVGGDGAMWKGRAVALFTGVMRGLVWKRDAGRLELNIGVVRDHLNLSKIIELADPELEPEMPANIRDSITAYLSSLPGFQMIKGRKQGQTTLDQHGFLQMQFTKILGNLTDVYGHVFLANQPQVDIADVVQNRRILVVMLPALEKSADEVANLGKIIVATLTCMMGSTLGMRFEDLMVAHAMPRPLAAPFTVFFDSFEYYTVSGMAALARHGRLLNMNFVFGCDAVERMVSNDEREAKAVLAACGYRMEFVTGEPEVAVLMHGGTIQLVKIDAPAAVDPFVMIRVNHTI